jgi:phage replication O-like protein O
MANPQPEDGHVDIANEIAEKFCAFRLSGEEWQVLWVVIRKTYGWHKKVDAISLGQFSSLTGMTRQHCHRSLKKLESKGLISVAKIGNSSINSYSIIKNFDRWQVLPKLATVLPKLVVGVAKIGSQVLPKKGNTKETIQKKITKETYSEDFLIFWKEYPLKAAKIDAYKSWNKMNGQRPELSEILLAIKRQKDWRLSADGAFRPEWKHPSVWLNKGCWEDMPVETGRRRW